MANISGYDSYSMSALFSSTGNTGNSTSSDFLGISYTDYASIKNGSYRKLLSSYYQNVENDGKTSSSESKDSKQTLTSIKSAAEDLKESSSALLTKGKDSLFKTKTDEAGNSYVDYDTDEVYKAVKSFIEDYNSLLDSAAESDTTSILRTAKSMVTYTQASEKALSQIGITIGSDNKLSIDEDKFKEASKARVQSVLQSTGGFVYQINAKATSMYSYADMESKKAGDSSKAESYKASIKSTSTSKDSTKTLGAIEEAAETASKSLSKLRATGTESLFNKITKTNEDGSTVTDYDTDAIYKAVNSFIKDYNTLLDKTEDSDTSSILQARRTMMNYTSANKTSLSAVGITIGSDGTLSIDEDKFKESSMTRVQSLFQDSYSFGYRAEQQIEKIASYAETEASKSNTYSDSGTYTNNYTSGDWYNSLI